MSDPKTPGQSGEPNGADPTPPDETPASSDAQPTAENPAADSARADAHPADAEPTGAYPAADAELTAAYPPADDDPTAAYPLADDQPTRAYSPGADAQPTEQYPPASYPGAGPSGVQPGSPGGPGGADPQSASAAPPVLAYGGPTARDSRPRGLAIAAIVAAGAGVLLSLGGFLPVPGIGLVLVIIGAILLLAGFVLGIVVLVSSRQGGKPLGIAALIISVLGGVLSVVALIASLVVIGLAADRGITDEQVTPDATSTAVPSPSQTPTTSEPGATPSTPPAPAPDAPAGSDPAAFVAAVRPEFIALLREVQPDLTEEQVAEQVSDDVVLQTGQALVDAAAVSGGVDAVREPLVQSLVESGISEERANSFFDTLAAAAQQYLVPSQ